MTLEEALEKRDMKASELIRKKWRVGANNLQHNQPKQGAIQDWC